MTFTAGVHYTALHVIRPRPTHLAGAEMEAMPPSLIKVPGPGGNPLGCRGQPPPPGLEVQPQVPHKPQVPQVPQVPPPGPQAGAVIPITTIASLDSALKRWPHPSSPVKYMYRIILMEIDPQSAAKVVGAARAQVYT